MAPAQCPPPARPYSADYRARVVGVDHDIGDTAPVVLAIDGNSMVHRSFHAQARTAAHTDGRPSWAVRGLLMQLVAAVDRVRPVCVVVGFDDPDASTRRERWPSYKANRSDKLETLVEQLLDSVATMRSLGLNVVVPPGLEADDVLASTASAAAAAGARTVVATSDRDSFALIDDTTSVLRIINGGVDASPLMTPARLELLLGVRPQQYRDFAALRGDASDNLPGVRGIGPRTAARVLSEFGTAAAAFDALDDVAERLGAGVGRHLAAAGARQAWELNCQVMAMHCDIPIALDLDAGPGVLPVPAAAVAEIYRRQNLTWTLRDALRVLADTDADVQTVRPYPNAGAAQRRWSDEPVPTAAQARLPRLVPRGADVGQLPLF